MSGRAETQASPTPATKSSRFTNHALATYRDAFTVWCLHYTDVMVVPKKKKKRRSVGTVLSTLWAPWRPFHMGSERLSNLPLVTKLVSEGPRSLIGKPVL